MGLGIVNGISRGRLALILSLWATLAMPLATEAQLIPDSTLDTEASRVLPHGVVDGLGATIIDGGAVRGQNLFHSFAEFNVDAGQRVYFANPAGIEAILSRVTGSNPSNIFGTLGVDGTADLFLLNPNGLVFGETAILDIQGSFYASTAEAIPLGDGVYSATAPEQNSLLTVHPSALFSTYLSDASGDIQNRGQLAVQGNMTLAASNLDLQGQVAGGGDLTLLGLDTVQIRDTTAVPFVGFAGGDLLVQGNQQVDIVALSHANSGLYSYGNMMLRSANPVGGDAHYWSGGSFRVETLDEGLGELFSPIDPIIRALGDVEIFLYQGGSLHILAGGSVNIGTAIITDADPGELGVDFLQETITLSDGIVVEIDGGARPTLDIRAGISPNVIGSPVENITGFDPILDQILDQNLQLTQPRFSNSPSTADIIVGDVWIDAPNGLVLLSNQYEPNLELSTGNILVTDGGFWGDGIYVSRLGEQSGAVFLDSRGDISVTNSYIDAAGSGNVGDIILLAADRVTFSGQNDVAVGAFTGITAFGEGVGGSLRVRANHLEVLDGARLVTSSFGLGNAGNVILDVSDTVRLSGVNARNGLSGGIFSTMGIFSDGVAGNLQINTTNLDVTDGAKLDATNAGPGNAGDISLNIRGTARFDGSVATNGFSTPSGVFSSSSLFGQQGTGGNVRINATNLEVTNGARLDVSSLGNGQGGNLILDIHEITRFDGVDATGNNASGAFSNFLGTGGRGGNVQINTNNLEVNNGAKIDVTGSGSGRAGNIILNISETARFNGVNPLWNLQSSGIFSNFISSGGIGQGGEIQIYATNLDVTNGARIDGSIFGGGGGGDIRLQITETAKIDGVNPFLGVLASGVYSRNLGGEGVGGNLIIEANNLTVTNGGRLDTSSFGNGDGGNIQVQVDSSTRFEGVNPVVSQLPSGVFSSVSSTGMGTGGDIQIRSNNLEILGGAKLSTENLGGGNAGNIMLVLQGQILATDGTIVTNAQFGSGGQILASARDIILRGDSDIQSFVLRGIGGGGDIVLRANLIIAFNDSDILAFSVDGTGGNILLDTTVFFGENFQPAPQLTSLEELRALDGNGRVDVNATGAIASGTITIPDVSFIENSLATLETAILDTAALTAGSCIARSDESLGNFVVTGGDGLPQGPDDMPISAYPTGTVRTVDNTTALQEPDGVYQLPNGRLVLSHVCP